MKVISLLRAYFKGIRFSAVILLLMMTFSMMMASLVISQINNIRFEYDIISSATAKAYYAERILSLEDFEDDSFDYLKVGDAWAEKIAALPAVDKVITTKAANALIYNGAANSIVLCDPALFELFPGLKDAGFDFSGDPDGCILGGGYYKSSNGVLEMTATKGKAPDDSAKKLYFNVNGEYSNLKRYMAFTGSGSKVDADCIFAAGSFILMQATDNVISELQKYTTISSDVNCFFTLRADATEAEISETMDAIGRVGMIASIDEIVANTEKAMNDDLRTKLPLPLFLLFASTVAYFSMTVLFVYRKRRDMAIIYLTGGSRRQCALLSVAACALVSLIPAAINIFFITNVEWLMRTFSFNLSGYYINGTSYLIIIGYAALTVAISALEITISMSRHTPLSYLRGTYQ